MGGYSLCSPSLPQKYSTSKLMNLRMKYRSSFEVIASILETIRGDGAGQYAIITRAGITHLQFKKYLESLTEIGFIETCIENGRIEYKANERGLNFLDQYYLLLEMLSGEEALNRSLNATYVFEHEAEAQNRAATSSATHWMR